MSEPDGKDGATFPRTRASIVVSAKSEDPIVRARALDTLVRVYGRPIYAYVRVRFRKSPEETEELVQSFFARAFEKSLFDGFDPERARFRTFVKIRVDSHVLNDIKASKRLKRGGGQVVDLDVGDLERALDGIDMKDGADENAADEAFQRVWVRTVIDLAVKDLEQRLGSKNRGVHFKVFKAFVLAPEAEGADPSLKPSYASVAEELGISVSQVTNYLFAARKEFRRAIVAQLRVVTASEEEFREQALAMLGPPPYS